MSSMTRTVTRLDQMLYAWLAEPDDHKFDRAFQKYHDEAFAGLVRYLSRSSTSMGLDFEQIAADALLKFFSRVGRDRRQASDSIMNALRQIQPLDFGAFHIREVHRWTHDVGLFHQTTMTFKLSQDGLGRDWMAEIQSLADKVPALQRQGGRILDPIRTVAAIAWAGSSAAEEHVCPPAHEDEQDWSYVATRDFVDRLKSDARRVRAQMPAVEDRHPGSTRFVECTWTVIEYLPLLRVPTNGYLSDMAQSLYLDECKALRRVKRRGPGLSLAASGTWHPLARINLDDEESACEYPDQGASSAPMGMVLAGDIADAAIDLESDLAGEEFCEKFYAYLCRPLELAEDAYRIAAAKGPAKAERTRVASLSGKLERVIEVLTMRIEGHTQEDIARALGISRSQVKYIAERVQEAYEQFAAACTRSLVRSRAAGASSHAER
jgi:DNA-directed RNA polymerase specialized sigma24 family protein